MKATRADDVKDLYDIPNIGKRMAHDFVMMGIHHPRDLTNKSPITLYRKLCEITHTRQDPCVLDTFMAAIDFMNGNTARPWWSYTKKRKQEYPTL